MSIFATALYFGADDHTDSCTRWADLAADEEVPENRQVAWFNNGRHAVLDDSLPCSCGAGPLVYEASHILPSPATLRRGSLDLGEIPGFLAVAGRLLNFDEGEDPDYTHKVWPYLRLWSVDGRASSQEFTGSPLVLDKDQVQRVRDYLSEWLERCGEEKAA